MPEEMEWTRMEEEQEEEGEEETMNRFSHHRSSGALTL